MIARTKKPYYPWTCWLLVAIVYLIQYGLLVFPSTITEQLQDSFKINTAALGVFSSSFLFTFVFFQIPAGLMFDHFGSRNLLFYSTLIIALGCVMLGVTQSYPWAVAARMLMGLGASFSFIGAVYIGRTWFPIAMFPVVVGLTEAMSGVGEVGLPSLFAALKNVQNWRFTILEIGIVTVVVAFLIYMHVRDKKSVTKKHTVKIWRDLLRCLSNKNLWLIGLFSGFAYTHFLVITDMWGIEFLKHRYHVTSLDAIVENSLVILGFTLGCAFIGYVLRFISSRRLMLICISAEMVCHVILTFYLVNIYIESVLLFTVGLLTSVVVLSYELAEKMVPSTSYGAAAGFVTMFMAGIGMFIVPIVGYLVNYVQLQVFLASAPVVVCAFIGILIAIRINLSSDFAFCDREKQ